MPLTSGVPPRLPRTASRTVPRAGNPLNRLRWTPSRLRPCLRSHSFDLTRFPAPAAWGTGATPPDSLPARGRASEGLGPQRLPAPPASHRPRWGVARFEGPRAAMPWPHVMPCGPAVAPPSSPGLRPATARVMQYNWTPKTPRVSLFCQDACIETHCRESISDCTSECRAA